MIRRIATAPGLGPALGPFSQATVAHGFVFTTGQVPNNEHGEVPERFEDKVIACIENLSSVLNEAGSDLEHVVKVNAYLTSPEQRDPFNEVFARYFGSAKPARTTVCVDIWEIALEIECIAVVSRPAPKDLTEAS